MVSGNSVHDALALAEGHYLERSKNYLGDTWAVANEVTALYGALAQAITGLPDSTAKRERFITVSVLLPAAARAGAVAALQAARLHFQEAEMLTRRAIECAGFTAIIWKAPELTDTLLSAYDTEETFKKFRSSFGGKRLARALGEIHSELPGQHAQRSKMTHPTLQSATLSQTQSTSGKDVEITLHYFDAQELNWEHRLPLCFGTTLYCHTLALRGLADLVFAEAEDRGRWDAIAGPVFQRFEAAATGWLKEPGTTNFEDLTHPLKPPRQ